MKRVAYILAPAAAAVAMLLGGPAVAQQQKTISIGTNAIVNGRKKQ